MQVAALLCAFLNAAVLARGLGAAGKGTLDLTILFVEMLAFFLSLGVGAANTFLLGARRFALNELLGNSLALMLPVAGLGTLLTLLLAAAGWLGVVVPGVPLPLLYLAIPLIGVTILRVTLSGLLLGLQRVVTVNAVDLAQNSSMLLANTIVIFGWGAGPMAVLLVAGSARLMALCLFIVLVWRAGGRFRPCWNAAVSRAMLSYALRGHLGNVLQFFNYRLDAFFVNFLIGPAGVGLYTVAVRLAELLWLLPNAVGMVLFPRAAASDRRELTAFTPRVFWITLGITAGAALGLALFGQLAIRLVFSAEFLPAYPALLLLLPGATMLGAAKVLTNDIAGRGFPLYNTLNSGIALMVTIGLDVLLIPRLGIAGAALASSIAYMTTLLIAGVLYRKLRRQDILASASSIS